MARAAATTGQSPKRQGRFTLNADVQAEEREASEIIIGGKTFHPRRLTSATMKRWQEVSPDPKDGENEISAVQALDQVLDQIGVLIADEEGVAPERVFLEEELDFEQAGKILAELGPKFGEEQERAGNLRVVGE